MGSNFDDNGSLLREDGQNFHAFGKGETEVSFASFNLFIQMKKSSEAYSLILTIHS